MRARLALVALAAVVLVVGLTHRHAVRRCDAANTELKRHAFGTLTPVGPSVVATIESQCRDARIVSNAAGALLATRQYAAASELAATAVRRAPDDPSTWLAVALVDAKRNDPRGERRALARERRLNPLAPSLPTAAPAASSAGAAAASP